MITLILFLSLCDSCYFVPHFLLFTRNLMFVFLVFFFSLSADFDEISGLLSLLIMFSIILVPLVFRFPFSSVRRFLRSFGLCFGFCWSVFCLVLIFFYSFSSLVLSPRPLRSRLTAFPFLVFFSFLELCLFTFSFLLLLVATALEAVIYG